MDFQQTSPRKKYSTKRLLKYSTITVIKTLGYLLFAFFLCLLAMMTHSFVYDICGAYYSIKPKTALLLVRKLLWFNRKRNHTLNTRPSWWQEYWSACIHCSIFWCQYLQNLEAHNTWEYKTIVDELEFLIIISIWPKISRNGVKMLYWMGLKWILMKKKTWKTVQ
jgi:hypothetical protein